MKLTPFGEAARLLRMRLDPFNNAMCVFELVDRVLELTVQHDTVGDHHHLVEHLAVLSVVQRREPMRGPRDAA